MSPKITTGPIFTVTYSKNWDGGKQEYNTAKNVVKKVFPTSKIIENRIDSYPIQVIVTATAQQQQQQHGGNSINHDGDASVELELWRGRQQDLFSKYKQKRNNAIKKIQASLEEYKITCATTTTPPTES